jgi:mannose-1-phosphate guanylyltransferase/mannose-6-phosphate isomerase
VLVSRQRDANGLKRLVAKAEDDRARGDHGAHQGGRPWSNYQSVDNGDCHQVKRIVVKPGQQLSLQKHYHRSEHWIVVRQAHVTTNEPVTTVHENKSIYIPIGGVHRLQNRASSHWSWRGAPVPVLARTTSSTSMTTIAAASVAS